MAWLLRDAEGLQELALAPCHEWLSDEDLVPVLARNPQLRSVALAGCGQLSRRALGALAEGCPRLQRLSLAHCDWVDGLALRGLADRCPALEELDLTACRQLKDEAIVYLAQRRGARPLGSCSPGSATAVLSQRPGAEARRAACREL